MTTKDLNKLDATDARRSLHQIGKWSRGRGRRADASRDFLRGLVQALVATDCR
jgi:hypothetical protein